jgi:HAMP domain-containing protein
MLNNATINDKLLIGAGVTLTCTVIMGVWSVFQFEKLYIETKKFDDFWLLSIHATYDLQRAVAKLNGAIDVTVQNDNLVFGRRRSGRQTAVGADSVGMVVGSDATLSHLSTLSILLRDYTRFVRSAEERAALGQLAEAVRTYAVHYERVVALLGFVSSDRVGSDSVSGSVSGSAYGSVHVSASGLHGIHSDSIKGAIAAANRAYGDALRISNTLITLNTRHTDAVASETLRHFLNSRLFVTVSLVLAIFISLGVNWLIARSIVRRLRLIQIAAERVSYGNLHVQLSMTEPDEIGRLARAFNRMTDNLKDTLNTLTQEQVREREAQLEALQAQLAPHFLFNSLTALGGLIMSNDRARAVEFLEKLSYTYRYVLMHRQQHLVTLEDELNFVNAYTFLASIRFKDGFYLQAEMLEEYGQYKLPSMALQLLLENAVKHNIVSAEQPLRISLDIEYSQHPTAAHQLPYLIVRNNIQRRTMNIDDLMLLSSIAPPPSFGGSERRDCAGDTPPELRGELHSELHEVHRDSTKVGLQNLQSRYRLLTNQVPEIIEADGMFSVILPLLAPVFESK